MPHFQLFDLIKWLHFASLAIGGGAAVAALLLSGLEDEQEAVRGLAPTLWKMVVAWGFRMAFLTGGLLLTLSLSADGRPFDQYYLRWKLPLVTFLLVMSELSPSALARTRRGAPLLALVLFLVATFVTINGRAFGRKSAPPAEVSAGPAS